MLFYVIWLLVCTMQRALVCARALHVSVNNIAIMWLWLGEWFIAELHDLVYTWLMGIVAATAAALCAMGFIPSTEVYIHRIIRHYSMGWAYLVSFERAAAQFL